MPDTVITEPFWPQEDVWPPGTLSKPAIWAYRLLQDKGLIKIQKVFYNRQTDVTRFKYEAMAFGDDLRQQLQQAKTEAAMRDGGQQVKM